jgi:nucleoside-diphosphate-sugar epimerase
MKQISILGCGWLGLPLAKFLVSEGFIVKGSTTTERKQADLLSLGVTPFLVTLESTGVVGFIEEFLANSETLIIDIPPQLRGKNATDFEKNQKVFVQKIKALLPFIEKSTVANVLFVSSTSVYGESNSIITEASLPNPNTESGQQLLEVERLLQCNSNFTTTILRFGGLVGEDRNPVKFMAGKINLENPDTPINFIHQIDCIGIIHKIIAANSWNEVYNGVSSFQPTREKYYTDKATEFDLPLPEFDHSKPSLHKRIQSDKLITTLGYTFIKNKL